MLAPTFDQFLERPRNTCEWKPGGAKTFRNRSSKLFEIYGTNLQNPSEALLRIHVPDKGKIFVQRDQAGAEALIVAYLTRHGAFRDLFLYNIKPHVYVAMHAFSALWAKELKMAEIINDFLTSKIQDLKDRPGFSDLYKAIKSHKERYFIGKKVCHASNYRIRWPTLQLEILKESEGKIYVTRAQAQYFLETYFKLFPEIAEWQDETEFRVKNLRILRNLFGYPREFYGNIFSEDLIKDAISWVPQSTVGCITNIATANLQSFIEDEGLDWDLLNNKHDSYLVQCPENELESCSNKMKEFLNITLKSPSGEMFTMQSEAKAGYNWLDYDESLNPNGLREL